jgi:dolichol-phosphate mannosyltransferase
MNAKINKDLIIIPTFNEENNVKILINRIKKNLKYNYDILFIDDNSSDNTREIIYKNKCKHTKLIKRKSKLGLGSAHKAGIKYAYKKGYRYLITMDADGTHNPKYITKMKQLVKNNDLVITNRFANKNSLSQWSIHRKFITTLRQIVVNFFFNTDLDSSGAFRCYNIKKIKLKDILAAKNNGYSFFTESTLLLTKKNYKITQIPINLPKRFSGNSKMKIWDMIFGFYQILKFSITFR